MAIEIRQLVIRAVVDDGGRSSGASKSSSMPEPHRTAGEAPRSAAETSHELGADDRQAIVNACVREVLRKLERARER